MPLKVPRIGNFIAVTGSQETADTNVQSDGLCANRKRLDVGIVHQQRNVPATTRIQLNGNGRRDATLRQWATPTNRQSFVTLCQKQRPILPPESSRCEFSRPAIMFLPKFGVFRPTRKKVRERFLKVPQSLLQRHTALLR